MLISEIFFSLQGEGSLSGVPSVFIRTAGCNLRCRWCDTPYASWHPEGREMKTAEILAEVSRFPAKHCVLTGGEPMIARGIHDLAAELAARGFHITIETAGTMPPAGIICHLASISPKMPNSTPHPDEIGAEWIARHEKTRHRPGLLAEWTASYPFQLKFVVAREDDAREALEYVDKERPGLARDKIFLMPEGTTSEVLRQREEWLIGFCQDTGCRFGDRLHIRLFGNKRGT